jgi:hypothetical protein
MKNLFIKEKSYKLPTIWGWLVIFVTIAVPLWLLIGHLNSFLSLNKPVDAKVMVVEGWLPTYVLAKAAQEFRMKGYSRLFSTGIAIDRGEFFWQEKTYADMGASSMRHLGLDSHVVVAVPSSLVKADRTFASACALKRFLDSTDPKFPSINVVSLGPHSRRSRLLFQQALGKQTTVGIYSYPDETYDPRTWWSTSTGFKMTVDEAISYCYTKFIFLMKKRSCL